MKGLCESVPHRSGDERHFTGTESAIKYAVGHEHSRVRSIVAYFASYPHGLREFTSVANITSVTDVQVSPDGNTLGVGRLFVTEHVNRWGTRLEVLSRNRRFVSGDPLIRLDPPSGGDGGPDNGSHHDPWR